MKKREFMDAILELHKQKGKFPLISELAKKFSQPEYLISEWLKVLVMDESIRKVGNRYFLPDEIESSQKFPDEENPSGIIRKKSSWMNSIRNISSITVIRYIMLFVGLGAAYLSIYYTSVWMQESLSTGLAWFLSFIMVTFGVIAFETIVAIINKEVSNSWSRWLVAAVFGILWLIVASFSIGSTIAGQYNQHIKMVRMNELQAIQIQPKMNELQAVRDSKTDLIARRNDSRRRLTLLLAASVDSKMENFTVIQSRILSTQTTIEDLDKKIEEARQQELDIQKENPLVDVSKKESEVPDFYGWMSSLFSISADQVQFWMSLFPAMFLDVIAPAALAIFFFMHRKKEKNSII